MIYMVILAHEPAAVVTLALLIFVLGLDILGGMCALGSPQSSAAVAMQGGTLLGVGLLPFAYARTVFLGVGLLPATPDCPYFLRVCLLPLTDALAVLLIVGPLPATHTRYMARLTLGKESVCG